ncbi:MAG TPA: adenylosuccinate synthase, partial [Planctomycetaceae bacterium]|nr:adenylosuccinate synthase [Planctomycetaceae bacterium]
YKLSLLPTGILRPGVVSVIAPGVVLNPQALLGEIETARGQGVDIGGHNLLISDRAHVIFPWHIAEETVLEESRGEEAIGTTRRGIGTCYRDKAGRAHAIRMGDMYHAASFHTRLPKIVASKNAIIRALAPNFEPLDAHKILHDYSGYAEQLAPHVVDTTRYLHRAMADGKRILFEGAQGSLLDIDHGTFPYVTSSSSSGCGIHSGSGVPERQISKMIGVVKAYTTRVGGGPFPTELHNEIGQHIRDVGHEYGTVTGRPRRCGWLDAVATRYGAKLSGVDCLSVMLLDVLSGLDELNVCEAYDIDGERTIDFPSHVEELAQARPVYCTLPGWKCDISNVRRMADFPKQARAYIDTVAELVGSRVEIVSVGPDREQTIFED